MKCQDIKKLLVAYLDGELTPVRRSLIELHLSSCQQCRQELEALKSIQAELRQALNMEADEVSPSPQLWEKLRRRLENTTPPSFRDKYGSWMNRPLWRAVVPIVLVVIVIGTLWGTGILPRFGGMTSPPPAVAPTPNFTVPATTTVPTTTAPRPTPVPGPSLGIMFDRVPDVISLYGAQAEIEMSFTNKSSDPRIMTFPPEINIIALPDVKPPDTIVRSFSPETRGLELASGESVSYSLVWDQKDDSGRQVSPGWYSVEVTLPTSRGSAARVLVLPPEGVMEKTIEVNQSLTENGITITLERIELTATGMKVYAFNTPPDYDLPQGTMLAPPQFMALHADAEYGIDGGAMKQTFPSAIRFLDDGILHTWGEYLDPVPSNAKELTFIITKLGDWEGPWEFKVPLK